jgi:hypothetical protein
VDAEEGDLTLGFALVEDRGTTAVFGEVSGADVAG